MGRLRVNLQQARSIYKYVGDRAMDAGGYVLVWVEAEGRYCGEHRLLVEAALGRHLTGDEEVHHVNGIRDDNSRGNLIVCSSEYHRYLDAIQRLRRRPYKADLWAMKQRVVLSRFLRLGRKYSSGRKLILKKIEAYIRQRPLPRGTPRSAGSLPQVPSSGKSK